MLREFTKSDWDGFAGAEKFTDGSEPLYGEIEILGFPEYVDENTGGNTMFIADRYGVELIDQDGKAWQLYFGTGFTPELGRCIATYLNGKRLSNIESMGFTRIL